MAGKSPNKGSTDDKVVTLPGYVHNPPSRERSWRPFRFRDLERVAPWEGPALRALSHLFPAGAGTAGEAVCNRMQELFDEPVRLMLDHLQKASFTQLERVLGDPAFLAVLTPTPHKSRGILEVELGLAHAIVGKLLGGEGESATQRALTDIEEGLLSFVVLEALKAISPNMDAAMPRLRLEEALKGPKQLAIHLNPDESFVAASFKAQLGAQGGWVRVVLPWGLLKLAGPPRPGPERRARRKSEVTKHLRRLSTVRTWLRVEVGFAAIFGRELKNVRAGDVVVVDEIWARADRGQGGRVELRIGQGRHGHAQGELAVDGGRFKVKLTAFFSGEPIKQPVPSLPPLIHKKPHEEPTHVGSVPEKRKHVAEEGDSVDILNDIPLQLAVELGRIRVTAEEVAALSVGQVIDLARGPGDPVELSVQGKIVARGELVEIEGQLGVRVLSLLR